MKTKMKISAAAMLIGIALATNVSAQNVNSTNGTTNFLTKWTNGAAFTIDNSLLFDNGTNIGLGTPTPTSLLHLFVNNATAYTAASQTNAQLAITNINQTNTSYSRLLFNTHDANGNLATGASITSLFKSHTALQVSADLIFQTKNAGVNSEVVRITAGKFVGIGTDNPLTKLHVKASEETYPNCAATLRLDFQTSTPPNGCGSLSSIWDISAFNGNSLSFTSPSIVNPVLNLSGTGNVGIGTAGPLTKLHLVGTFKVVDGTQGAGKVLTSDATGTASWQTLPGGGIGGSGTTNTVPKFTAGTTIGNSQITDNGTNVAMTSLAGTGTRIVVANASGQLSTQTIPSVGDNLGNHIATQNIKLNGNRLVNTGFLGLGIDNSGNTSLDNDLFVNGDFTVNQTTVMNGTLTVNALCFNLTGGDWLVSDIRYKKNIEELASPLEKVMKIKGVRYEYNKEKFPKLNFREGKTIGFLAQNLKEVFPEAVMLMDDGYYAVNYSAVIPVLVEAMKEQQAMIEKQSKQIEELQKGTTPVINQNTGNVPSRDVELSSTTAFLYNAQPNPFDGSTIIRYFVPENSTGIIKFYDEFGKEIKNVELTTEGQTAELNLSTINLAAGIYSYSLIVNGKTVDTKKMIRMK